MKRTWIIHGLIIINLLNCINAISQQKPAWLMPLYFEDATGAKDTLYIGYDTLANKMPYIIDTIFDEDWIKVDTTRFNAFFYMYPGYSPVGEYTITSDLVRKTEISSWPLPHDDIGFIDGKMPITLKWEDSLLNSPMLNFIDISPRPRARIDLFCSSCEPGYINCPIELEPLTLTNYPSQDIKYFRTDSLKFWGSGNFSPRKAICNMHIIIVPHNFQGFNNAETLNKQNFKIYPNPFTTNINVSNPNLFPIEISIINAVGQLIYFTKYSDALLTIDLKSLKEGIYIIKITSLNNTYTNKLLKLT